MKNDLGRFRAGFFGINGSSATVMPKTDRRMGSFEIGGSPRIPERGLPWSRSGISDSRRDAIGDNEKHPGCIDMA